MAQRKVVRRYWRVPGNLWMTSVPGGVSVVDDPRPLWFESPADARAAMVDLVRFGAETWPNETMERCYVGFDLLDGLCRRREFLTELGEKAVPTRFHGMPTGNDGRTGDLFEQRHKMVAVEEVGDLDVRLTYQTWWRLHLSVNMPATLPDGSIVNVTRKVPVSVWIPYVGQRLPDSADVEPSVLVSEECVEAFDVTVVLDSQRGVG